MSMNASAEPRHATRPAHEQAIVLDGPDGPLVGILTRPPGPANTTLLMVADPGGTRTGPHRLLTELARTLSHRKIASLRFDVTGQGDSPGTLRSPGAWTGDLAAAARALVDAIDPTDHGHWLLADGESAIAATAQHAATASADRRLRGVICLLRESEAALPREPSRDATDALRVRAGHSIARPALPARALPAARAADSVASLPEPPRGLLARLRRMLGLGPATDRVATPAEVLQSMAMWNALVARHPAIDLAAGSVLMFVLGDGVRAVVVRQASSPQPESRWKRGRRADTEDIPPAGRAVKKDLIVLDLGATRRSPQEPASEAIAEILARQLR